MEKHILSKSTFQKGSQCYKALYLYKNSIYLRDPLSARQKAIFGRGNRVGELAQQLFPGGVDTTKNQKKIAGIGKSQALVLKTQKLIEEGQTVIYEAAFQYDGVLIILDILVKQDNKWYAYEVKSSSKISYTYLVDAAVQYWVISHSGLALADIFLVTMNTKYIRKGKVDVQGLFKTKSVQKKVLELQAEIAEKIGQLKQVDSEIEEPEKAIGEQCFQPYQCDFMGHCWKNVPSPSIFDINGLQKTELFELYNAGIKRIEEIPVDNELNTNVNIHLTSVREDKEQIDKNAINTFMNKLQYPLLFLDFETFMPAVPIFEGTRPYQHIPFQYSIHGQESAEAQLTHKEFLAEHGFDPRKSLLDSLLKDTEGEGSILVYDALMERNVMNGLKNLFPEFTIELEQRLSRIVDLMEPFKARHYYHPGMNNSHSIKNVLHALHADLSYTDLDVSNGTMAMIEYEKLQTETDMFKALETRDHLLAYCKMDTLAMVKVLSFLKKAIAA